MFVFAWVRYKWRDVLLLHPWLRQVFIVLLALPLVAPPSCRGPRSVWGWCTGRCGRGAERWTDASHQTSTSCRRTCHHSGPDEMEAQLAEETETSNCLSYVPLGLGLVVKQAEILSPLPSMWHPSPLGRPVNSLFEAKATIRLRNVVATIMRQKGRENNECDM